MRASEFLNEMSIGLRKKRTPNRLEYKGYRCTKDCGGHKAGYAWAKSKGINRVDQCPTDVNNSFWEGCKSCAQGR
jgi:hypothetical protein